MRLIFGPKRSYMYPPPGDAERRRIHDIVDDFRRTVSWCSLELGYSQGSGRYSALDVAREIVKQTIRGRPTLYWRCVRRVSPDRLCN